MPDDIAPAATGRTRNPGLTPMMLNHAAWITQDVAATADFYTRVMGMELASTVYDDHVPSTGEDFPYFHVFFRMKDGSTIAFFEAPGVPPRAKPTHPAYETFEHIALQVETREEVLRWHAWLQQNGIDVTGPTDHKGMILSIYFRDPNGIRLEITTPLDVDWNQHTEQGYKDLTLWVSAKEKARRDGRDVKQAVLDVIREERKRYEGTGASSA